MKTLPQALVALGSGLLAWGLALPVWAQAVPKISVTLSDAQGPEQVVPALKILLLLTLLSVAPAILISMTSFTRIVVVLSFLRQALGLPNIPPTQIILALSLLLTAVVMTPAATRFDREALSPYSAGQIAEAEFWSRSQTVVRDFLLFHVREDDLSLFYEITNTPSPAAKQDVRLTLLVPAFMISELRTGFEMGFLLFLPFVLIDLVVASVLTAMGMVMLPPSFVSAPLKLVLFVVIDGWSLLTRSLVHSFGVGM